MPELPEVEVCRRQLTRWATGRTLDAVVVVDRAVVRGTLSTKPSDALPDGTARLEALVGLTAGEPSRYGKRLGWAFGDAGLLCHLGMTGHWVRRPASDGAPDLARLGLVFGDDTVWYLDGRRFGCVVPVEAREIDERLRANTGPDAVLDPLGPEELQARVTSKKALKVALMDQDRLAGLGNIHASEACFRAKISPRRPANGLSTAEWARLAAAITDQLTYAIDAESATEDMLYVNLGGPNPFAVYKKAGEPCPRCRAPIVAEDHAGRTTYWCERCQPDDVSAPA